jgi:hypothetical protein
MARGAQASILWLGAAATAVALYPYSRTQDCRHWHDGSFLVLAAAAAVLAGCGTYCALANRSRAAAIILAITLAAGLAVIALVIAYASAASACAS